MDTNAIFQDIAKAVRRQREKAGLSRIELAEIAGTGKTVIFDIEHGKESVRTSSLLKVMGALDLKFEISGQAGAASATGDAGAAGGAAATVNTAAAATRSATANTAAAADADCPSLPATVFRRRSPPILRRSIGNPILTRDDLPLVGPLRTDVSSVFNPGACRWGGRELLLLRVQDRGRGTRLWTAWSDDCGRTFKPDPDPVELDGIDDIPGEVHHIYDPRLTVLDDGIVGLVAIDVDDTCRLGLIRSEDGLLWRCEGMVSGHDVRNGVLFPEKIGGRWLRLERPNRSRVTGGPPTGDAIVLAESDDLLSWREVGEVMRGRPHLWDELIGSGPPPLKTRAGWLHVYHGVATHFASANIYQAGVSLLDLEDPSRVIARGSHNVLEPRESYETTGQVPNVVFPSGMVAERIDADGFALLDSPVRIYYGAADTCVAVAWAVVGDLLAACRE